MTHASLYHTNTLKTLTSSLLSRDGKDRAGQKVSIFDMVSLVDF